MHVVKARAAMAPYGDIVESVAISTNIQAARM